MGEDQPARRVLHSMLYHRALTPCPRLGVAPIIRDIQASGAASHRGIARSLNARGIAAARAGVLAGVQDGSIPRRVEWLGRNGADRNTPASPDFAGGSSSEPCLKAEPVA